MFSPITSPARSSRPPSRDTTKVTRRRASSIPASDGLMVVDELGQHEYSRISIGSTRLSYGGNHHAGSINTYLAPNLGLEETENERKQRHALEWLSACSPTGHYNRVRKICQDGTGQWFLQSDDFHSWMRSDHSFMWLHGPVGCGKTILSATIIDALQARCRHSQREASLSFFLFDFNNPSEQQVGNLLKTLIKDLCSSNGAFPAPVLSLCEKYKLTPAPTSELLNTFLTAYNPSKDNYIVIDGLDECGVRHRKARFLKMREELMDAIQQISNAGKNLRVLVTSRDGTPPDQIDDPLRKIMQEPTIKAFDVLLDSSKADEDIEKVIDARFCVGSSIWQGMDASLLTEIRKSLLSNGKGRFRLVACQLDYLESLVLQDLTVSELRTTVDNLPSDVQCIYNGILQRMPRRERDFHIMKYMACSLRPLRLQELGELTLLSKDCTEFSQDNVPAIGSARYMARAFSSLITVNGEMDRDDIPVQVSHRTVMDCLSNPQSQFHVEGSAANASLAASCLSYLKFCVQSAPTDTQTCTIFFAQRRLLEYAINSWYTHASRAYRETRQVQRPDWRASTSIWSKLPLTSTTKVQESKPQRAPPRQPRVQKPDAQPQSADIVLDWIDSAMDALEHRNTAVSIALYQKELAKVASSGYEHILTWILNQSPVPDVNFSHYFALEYALSGRVDNLLQILLGTSRTLSHASNWFGGLAAQASTQTIVTALVNNHINPNARNIHKETPLHWAAASGRKTAVKMLLDNAQVEVDAKNASDETPLVLAAKNGHDKIVWLLLVAGASPLSSSEWSALEEACKNGHYGCAKLLVEAGADVNHSGLNGNTPLQSACLNGHESLVIWLIGQGAKVNAPAGSVGTALQAAGRAANRSIIDLLIKHNARISTQQGHVSSPLTEASKSGLVMLVQILLENGTDVNYQSGEHNTALQAACYKGNRETVELLLKRGADINIEGGYYGTALQAACYSGSLPVIKMLLNSGAKVNAQGGKYDTALQAACYRGNREVVLLLLACGAKINTQGGIYCTPLQAACYSGNQYIVEVLLKSGAKVNVHGGQFGTALQAARIADHHGITKMLLDSGAMFSSGGVDKSSYFETTKTHRLVTRTSLPRLVSRPTNRERKGSLLSNR